MISRYCLVPYAVWSDTRHNWTVWLTRSRVSSNFAAVENRSYVIQTQPCDCWLNDAAFVGMRIKRFDNWGVNWLIFVSFLPSFSLSRRIFLLLCFPWRFISAQNASMPVICSFWFFFLLNQWMRISRIWIYNLALCFLDPRRIKFNSCASYFWSALLVIWPLNSTFPQPDCRQKIGNDCATRIE